MIFFYRNNIPKSFSVYVHIKLKKLAVHVSEEDLQVYFYLHSLLLCVDLICNFISLADLTIQIFINVGRSLQSEHPNIYT